jgi:Skp family chaperone for outer membrane proteins
MRRLALWAVAPLLLLLVAGGAPAVAAGPSVAVVDMVRLLKAHPRFKEVDGKFEQRQKQAEDFAKSENTRLEQLKGEISLMNAADPNRRQKEKELASSLVALKFEIEWRQQEAQREYVRGLEVLYAEVQALVARHAREQGIPLVLLKQDTEMKAGDLNDWGLKVQLRTVVHADASLDITDAVLRLLPAPAASAVPPPAPPR